MGWKLELGSRSGIEGGWRRDFPLEHDLPSSLTVDAANLGPMHAMLALRLRVFLDWHTGHGRRVRVIAPVAEQPRALLAELDAVAENPQIDVVGALPPAGGPVLLPITRLRTAREIDPLAQVLNDRLERLPGDLSALGGTLHMAFAELTGNSLEHGLNEHGTYVAVHAASQPRTRLVLVVADLGIGIPEHIRQQYPEWSADEFAIAQATREGVTGTGSAHRGFGFTETFAAAMTRLVTGATMTVRSGRGELRVEVAGGPVAHHPLEARYKRGTWISFELTPVR